MTPEELDVYEFMRPGTLALRKKLLASLSVVPDETPETGTLGSKMTNVNEPLCSQSNLYCKKVKFFMFKFEISLFAKIL